MHFLRPLRQAVELMMPSSFDQSFLFLFAASSEMPARNRHFVDRFAVPETSLMRVRFLDR
jgi:hypothetical protein